jgi:hypothetical protein
MGSIFNDLSDMNGPEVFGQSQMFPSAFTQFDLDSAFQDSDASHIHTLHNTPANVSIQTASTNNMNEAMASGTIRKDGMITPPTPSANEHGVIQPADTMKPTANNAFAQKAGQRNGSGRHTNMQDGNQLGRSINAQDLSAEARQMMTRVQADPNLLNQARNDPSKLLAAQKPAVTGDTNTNRSNISSNGYIGANYRNGRIAGNNSAFAAIRDLNEFAGLSDVSPAMVNATRPDLEFMKLIAPVGGMYTDPSNPNSPAKTGATSSGNVGNMTPRGIQAPTPLNLSTGSIGNMNQRSVHSPLQNMSPANVGNMNQSDKHTAIQNMPTGHIGNKIDESGMNTPMMQNMTGFPSSLNQSTTPPDVLDMYGHHNAFDSAILGAQNTGFNPQQIGNNDQFLSNALHAVAVANTQATFSPADMHNDPTSVHFNEPTYVTGADHNMQQFPSTFDQAIHAATAVEDTGADNGYFAANGDDCVLGGSYHYPDPTGFADSFDEFINDFRPT